MFFPCTAPAYTSLFGAPSSMIDSLKAPTDRRSHFRAYMASIFHQKNHGCDYDPPSFCGSSHFPSRIKRLRDRIHHAFHGSFPFQKSSIGSFGGFSAARLLSSTVQSANTDYSPCGAFAVEDGAFGCEMDADSWAFLDSCSPMALCTHSASSVLSLFVDGSNYLLVTPSFTLTNCAQASRRSRFPEAKVDAASVSSINKSPTTDSSGSSANSSELMMQSSGPSTCEPRYYGAELSNNNSSCSSNFDVCCQKPLMRKKAHMSLTTEVGDYGSAASLTIALVITPTPGMDFFPLVH